MRKGTWNLGVQNSHETWTIAEKAVIFCIIEAFHGSITKMIIRRYGTINLLKFRKYSNVATAETTWPERILSGIQPTGVLHIGNYFGAVKNWVELQNKNSNVLCSIVDLHALTLPYAIEKLPNNILLMTASLLACGIDPNKSILFLQSQVPEHTQLCWVLGCLTTLPKLAQLPQYREKSEKLKEIPLGLYLYPVLQAADILLYKATKVPVGEDQLQHLQLSGYLARKFNRKFGETFPVPKPLIYANAGARIKNLREPLKKMSKSHINEKSRIEITDPPDLIVEKMKKAVTDSTSRVTYDPENRPGVSNLIDIHSLLTGTNPNRICEDVENLNTGEYKLIVAEALVEMLKPIQSEIISLLNDKPYLTSLLSDGAQKACSIATDTWKLVSKQIGASAS
ncbi:tryptophan--tRNA ligase, mitochondrial [Planococcus citri]|uniref:tryptophan--tRNA ligase, mitochondrial n=1 Tax=Planococcus citri TaxID=170843 RepID=UPI0031F8A3C5